MQPCRHRADGAARLVAATAPRHIDQRACTRRALQQHRVGLLHEHTRCAFTAPPAHQEAAPPFLRFPRDLQHGGHARTAHGQQIAATGRDRRAIGREPPARQIVVEHHASPTRSGVAPPVALDRLKPLESLRSCQGANLPASRRRRRTQVSRYPSPMRYALDRRTFRHESVAGGFLIAFNQTFAWRGLGRWSDTRTSRRQAIG
jgi:hypothetical protein